jgi:diaminopimelate decarboxylase
MDWFTYRNGQLFCEDLALDTLAQQVGTPAYIYSRRSLEHHYDQIARAFAPLDPLICYSIKSCGNIHLCRLLADRGAGMDVVSGGELLRAQHAGTPGAKIVYAGVGKTDAEIRQAFAARIGWFNIESEAEFENIAALARHAGCQARAALRINPGISDPKTHHKTATGNKETKFGVDIDRAPAFFARYGRDPYLHLSALHLHIGSPIYSPEPYVRALRAALTLVESLRAAGVTIDTLDLGGGFAADYQSGQAPQASDYAAAIVPLLAPFHQAGGRIILEPGRSIAANAGVLLTRVQYVKRAGRKTFVIVDSGMNHLIRPTLYDAFHFIWPTRVAPNFVPTLRAADMQLPSVGLEPVDVVGPICESGDYFAQNRPLPPVARGDLLCIFTAGAYGMTMASNYNAQPRPPEILVEGAHAQVIRRRETYADLIAPELNPTAVETEDTTTDHTDTTDKKHQNT